MHISRHKGNRSTSLTTIIKQYKIYDYANINTNSIYFLFDMIYNKLCIIIAMLGKRVKKRKIKKYMHHTIMTAVFTVVTIVIAISLIITNIFIPIKYLAAYMVAGTPLPHGKLQITFFQLDEGESTLITFPDGKVALIDGGNGGYSSEFKLIKTLNQKGINTIDYMFLTSLRDSRIGGLCEIVKYKDVKTIFLPYITSTDIESYEKLTREIEKTDAKVEISAFGAGVGAEDYLLGILSPPADIYSEDSPYFDLNNDLSSLNINSASAVYWLEYDGVKMLLLGDSTEAVQNRILRSFNTDSENFKLFGRQIQLNDFDLVKIAYGGHTSNFSSRLMSTSQFQAAILTGDTITVKTLSELLGTNKKIYSTESMGDITITISGGNYAVE